MVRNIIATRLTPLNQVREKIKEKLASLYNSVALAPIILILTGYLLIVRMKSEFDINKNAPQYIRKIHNEMTKIENTKYIWQEISKQKS